MGTVGFSVLFYRHTIYWDCDRTPPGEGGMACRGDVMVSPLPGPICVLIYPCTGFPGLAFLHTV